MKPSLTRTQIVALSPVWALRLASDVAASVAGIIQTHVENVRYEIYGLSRVNVNDPEVARAAQHWAEATMRQPDPRAISPDGQREMTIEQMIAAGAASGESCQGPTTFQPLD